MANSGTSKCLSSSSVLVQHRAAMIPPALVPVMTRGSKSASKNALTTPKLTFSGVQMHLEVYSLIVAEGCSA